MPLFFDPQPIFDSSVQEKLHELTEQALSDCKVQFSAGENHAEPECHFHFSGWNGNTGGLHGIHVTFTNMKNMRESLDNPDRLKQLIHHELVHFFQARRHSREPFEYLPTWFHEGMAVAFSGQGLTVRKRHLDEDLAGIGGDHPWDQFFLMKESRNLDFSKPPYDILYDAWGALFIYAMSDQPSIYPQHVVSTDNGSFSKVDAADCAKALAFIDAAHETTFEIAMKQNLGKDWITESGIQSFLRQD
ncbi:hypothetical protein ACM1ZW_12735 [Pseudomonas sp. NFX71]|uniref:hypothetical protein n=1 Tax=Pseudomonas sp. NFX71 TaxID=3399121 RepID=UPI003A850B57